MLALDVLGNPIRREILGFLRDQPLSVRDIADHLPQISRPAVSRHLRLLRQAGLVGFSEVGTANVYRLKPEGFASVRDYVDAFWSAALPRFERIAEGLQS